MKTVLITGANRSIGFETARQLLQQGYYVYLGCRDIKKGEQAVSQLHAEGLTQAEPIEIDTDNLASIQAARQVLGQKTQTLDVLINNAGILGGVQQDPLETDISIFRKVFETNFFGVIQATQAFVDLLRQSSEPRIVNVTSGLGSLTLHSDPAWKYYQVKPSAYVSSKAALNAYTIVLAYELRNTPFKVKAATLDSDGLTGQFFSDDNAPETGISPW